MYHPDKPATSYIHTFSLPSSGISVCDECIGGPATKLPNPLSAPPYSESSRPIEIPRDLAAIEREIEDKQAGLVVFDPFSSFVGAEVNTYSDPDVRRCLYKVAMMTERTDAAVLIVRHLKKDLGKSAKYRGGGSIGILGAARAAWLVAQDPNEPDGIVLTMSKVNDSKPPDGICCEIVSASNGSWRIRWGDRTNLTADEILPSDSAGKKISKTDQCAELIERLLSEGPRSTKDVVSTCEAVGFKMTTIKAAPKNMG